MTTYTTDLFECVTMICRTINGKKVYNKHFHGYDKPGTLGKRISKKEWNESFQLAMDGGWIRENKRENGVETLTYRN